MPVRILQSNVASATTAEEAKEARWAGRMVVKGHIEDAVCPDNHKHDQGEAGPADEEQEVHGKHGKLVFLIMLQVCLCYLLLHFILQLDRCTLW